MLDFCDKPYRWFPPKRNPLIARALGLYNGWHYLPNRRRIEGVQVTGRLEAIRSRSSRDRLLFLPNHPTHDDAYIYLEALRQIDVSTHVMAAYDVFLRSWSSAFVMQSLGCFSVDREGSDQQAMKQAMQTLSQGNHALTIFPEGNVYLQNDIVTPFHEGAAFLGLRSAKTLAADGVRVLAVPVSIKVTHVHDVREPLTQRLNELARVLGAPIDASHAPLAKVHKIGLAALAKNLRHRGHDVPESPELALLVKQAAEAVIGRLEMKMGSSPREGETLVERIRRARRVIHEIRVDESRAADHAAASHWADEAMLAFRIASYAGNYVASQPTLDRYAETVEKLAEDIFSRVHPPVGRRIALVHFGEPIDLNAQLAENSGKSRHLARQVTEHAERAVQQGVDQLNALNVHAGARIWEE